MYQRLLRKLFFLIFNPYTANPKIMNQLRKFYDLTAEETADLIIVSKPLEFLIGRHSQKDLTYEDLEESADDIVLDMVKKKSP